MYKEKLLIVRFNNEIGRDEIPLFRGAVISAMENTDVLFHNHNGDKALRYAYPLIQYKRINRKASIVCIGDGTSVIGQLFSSDNFDVYLGKRKMKLEVESIKANSFLIQLWNDEFEYHINHWLPLNQENYNKYLVMDSVVEKCAMLESLLTGNILSFAKGLGIFFDQKVQCKITSINEPYLITYKGVKMMGFDSEFKTNVSLPDYIGLGKGVSLGMGTVVRKRERNVNNETNK